MFSDPTFYVAIAFVLFIVLFGRKLVGAVTVKLDERTDLIRTELEEATRLREEAQALLAKYQRQQREAQAEADAIINHAKEEAERITQTAQSRLADQLRRREELARQRIEQAEARALKEMHDLTVEIAIDAATRVISKNLDEDRAAGLVDDAIKDLPKRLN